jgi:hypothetical protein
VGWGSAVVGTGTGTGASVVGASAGDVVVSGELVGAMVGTLVGKLVLEGGGVADELGGTVVVVAVRGRTAGLVGLSTPVVGLAGRVVADAGRTSR